ncbi:MAG: type VI secretion system-associated protein TagF [Betaproteobacteria bacterium]|nr:type VI secretion system-associated protein TagF [Betaproteobacteria bacterium]
MIPQSAVPPTRAAGHAETGFFGKLPSKGDFLSRRLPSGFIEVWDAWLQAGIASSRGDLGEAWPSSFLEAAVWRFFIPARMVTERAWIGIVLPSADRVGRYFPLTIAAGIARAHLDGAATLDAANEWLAAISSAALDALGPAGNAETFDARVAALAFPLAAVAGSVSAGPSPSSKPAESRFLGFALEQDERLVTERLRGVSEGAAQDLALWWTIGSKGRVPCLLASDSLPAGRLFCALLDGRWAEHGWLNGCSMRANGV